jgi:hypothetical protein
MNPVVNLAIGGVVEMVAETVVIDSIVVVETVKSENQENPVAILEDSVNIVPYVLSLLDSWQEDQCSCRKLMLWWEGECLDWLLLLY